jgi:penicillin-binding protein 2
VHEVFEKYYEGAPADDALLAAIKDVPKAVSLEEGELDANGVNPENTEEVKPANVAPARAVTEQKTLGGFFKRLFKRS